MKHYVAIKIPQEGQLLDMVVRVVPTGQVKDGKAEGICVTPRSHQTKVWFTKNQIVHDQDL